MVKAGIFARGILSQYRAWTLGFTALFIWGLAPVAKAVPSFSRQTGMTCMACHTVFPELTAYGRWFKLNGYTSGEADKITEKDDKTGDVSLEILKGTPLSAMIQVTDTFTQKQTINAAPPAPGDDSMGIVGFPEQLSLFYAGEITPNMGAFAQMTYDFQSGFLHADNTDIRYATHFDIGGQDAIFGMTLNNNPTVQDVYNTTPGWGFPYSTSANVPKPAAAPFITGLGGQSAGLGAYLSLDKLLYVEASAYRSAPQGGELPGEIIRGYAPYLRLALSQEVGDNSLELGGFAMMMNGEPSQAIAGAVTTFGTPPGYLPDYFEDWGADAQYQYTTKEHQFSAQACWIREYQTWNSTYTPDGVDFGTQNLNDQLELFKANLTYYYERKIGFTLGYFGLGGTTDNLLYASNATFNPNSQGMVYELNFVPWLNSKFTLQYTQYFFFNGGGTDTYDGTNLAKDNDTLMAMAWFAY